MIKAQVTRVWFRSNMSTGRVCGIKPHGKLLLNVCSHQCDMRDSACVYFAIGSSRLSDWTRGYLTTASCSRDQVWKQILLLQPAVPAAAGSSPSDLLNLPHFNLASTPLLSSNRSLAPIPECPSFFFFFSVSPQRSGPSGASVEPDRRGPELQVKRERKKKKINEWPAFFLNNITNHQKMEKFHHAKCCCF